MLLSSNLNLTVPIESIGFANTSYNISCDYSFTANELAWAIVTTGLNDTQVNAPITNGKRSEILHKLNLINSSFDTYHHNGKIYLKKSDSFNHFERSEKAYASFCHGMVFTKLFAEKILNFPYMVFVDKKLYDIIYGTNLRPDYIAYNPQGNKWGVFGAKGRSSNYDIVAIMKAKEQTKAISSIQGQKDILRVACQTFFNNKKLHFRMIDPPYRTHGSDYNDGVYFYKYYHSIYSSIVVGDAGNIKKDSFNNICTILDSTYKIGMPKKIYVLMDQISLKLNEGYTKNDILLDGLDELHHLISRRSWIDDSKKEWLMNKNKHKDERYNNIYLGSDGVSFEIIKQP